MLIGASKTGFVSEIDSLVKALCNLLGLTVFTAPPSPVVVGQNLLAGHCAEWSGGTKIQRGVYGKGDMTLVSQTSRWNSPGRVGQQTASHGPFFIVLLGFLAAHLLFWVPVAVCAELSGPSEYEIKATFIYNFIKFTEWPAAELGDTDDPFVIGVVGKDPFGTALEKTVEGEKVHNRAIAIRRFARMDSAAIQSHVLFISASETYNLPAILKGIEGQAVLSVSDMQNFAERGGVINLKTDRDKIVFEVNLDAPKGPDWR